LKKFKITPFFKFFFTYFISVALLILASGFFYFEQMRSQLLKAEHFSLIEYARDIKMQEDVSHFPKDFHYRFVNVPKHIDITNFTITTDEFMKYIPTRKPHYYMQVFKSKHQFYQNLQQLRYKIILIQLLLLSIFAIISYLLARNALKPLQESIETLDRFAKDLIHDLNTPVTAMKLNIKLLQKEPKLQNTKALQRLQKSIQTISELRVNLTTLLEKKTFQIQKINVCSIVNDVLELHQPNYPNLTFTISCSVLYTQVNSNGLKQILHNLISNACKYNKKDGYVYIYTKGNVLYIEDGGIGIQEPDKIFDRSYSTQNSTGFGLDIVKRLCEAMDIEVGVRSSQKGSCFWLKFS